MKTIRTPRVLWASPAAILIAGVLVYPALRALLLSLSHFFGYTLNVKVPIDSNQSPDGVSSKG